MSKSSAPGAHGLARWSGMRGSDLDQKLVPPVVQVLEGFLRVDIIHQHAAVCSPVESDS